MGHHTALHTNQDFFIIVYREAHHTSLALLAASPEPGSGGVFSQLLHARGRRLQNSFIMAFFKSSSLIPDIYIIILTLLCLKVNEPDYLEVN